MAPAAAAAPLTDLCPPAPQCGRFHHLAAFDPSRRSCRARLEEHNRRRRELVRLSAGAGAPGKASGGGGWSTGPEGDHDSAADSGHGTSSVSGLPDTPAGSEGLGPGPARGGPALGLTAQEALADWAAGNAFNPGDDAAPFGVAHFGDHHALPLPLAPSGAGLQGDEDELPSLPELTAAHAYGLHAIDQLYGQRMPAPGPPHAAGRAPPPPSPAPPLEWVSANVPLFGGAYDAPEYLSSAPRSSFPLLPLLPLAGAYEPPDRVVRLAFKMFDATPAALPPSLRAQMEGLVRGGPLSSAGYVRPGCVHLTIDLRLPEREAAELEARPTADLAAEAIRRGALGAAGLAPLLVQSGGAVEVARRGRVLGQVALEGAAAPELSALLPCCVAVEEGGAASLQLHGRNVGRAGDLVLCRQQGAHAAAAAPQLALHLRSAQPPSLPLRPLRTRPAHPLTAGRYLTVDMLNDEAWAVEEAQGGDRDPPAPPLDWDAGSVRGVLDAAERQSVASSVEAGWPRSAPFSVEILGLRCGGAEVEVQCGGVLTAARPLLVLPDAAAAAEVRALAARAPERSSTDSLLRDAGVVVGHLHGGARAPAALVAALAARTAAFALVQRCPALALVLLPGALEAGQSAEEVAASLAGHWREARPAAESREAVERWVAAHCGTGGPGPPPAVVTPRGESAGRSPRAPAKAPPSPLFERAPAPKAGAAKGAGAGARAQEERDEYSASRTQTIEWQVRLRCHQAGERWGLWGPGERWGVGVGVGAAALVCGVAVLLARAEAGGLDGW
jgi:hypothetical protein